MKRRFTLLIVSFLLIIHISTYAQQTGDITQSFSSGTVYIHVPVDYDPNKQYPVLHVWHGTGMDGSGMRALMKKPNLKIGAIIIAPTFGGSDGWPKYKSKLTESLDWVKSNYNVDPGKIIISGYSAGGQICFRLGLENPTLVNGILGFNPAITSQNFTPTMWNNIKAWRMATIEGTADFNFQYVDPLMKDLINKGAELLYTTKQGIAHADNTYFNSQEFSDDYYESYLYIIGGGDQPPGTAFSASTTSGCNSSLTVQFTDQSTGTASSWLWDFGDGATSTEQNPTHTYNAAGTYSVTLKASNEHGENTATKTDYITVGEGASYQAVNGAAPDTSMGGGGFNPAPRGLFFNTMQDVVIEKVTVYSQTSGNAPIQITGAGQTIFNASVSVSPGINVIELNANVPRGNNYLIQCNGFDLYRNNSGVSFPYKVENMIDITASNATSNPSGFYYFFYDWQVRQAGCSSDPVGLLEEQPYEAMSAYPNPGTGLFNINIPEKDHDFMLLKVYDLTGNLVKHLTVNNTNMMLDIQQQPKGMYIIQLYTEDNTYYTRITKY